MKRVGGILLAFLLIFLAVGCGKSGDEKVIVYLSSEEYRVEYFQKRLKEEFPHYEVVLEYLPTGTHAAKLEAEGLETECDISFELDYGYLGSLEKLFADLSAYDSSPYLAELVPDSGNYLPTLRNGGCIAINREILEQKELPVPDNYRDLLKPEYKGLISMPNPKASGTGYMFLKSLVNAWGEEEALAYFDALTSNILQYTSSGSGPVNALVQGEAAIGLAMTAQTVTEINRGVDLELYFFEEGSPYSLYGMAMIKGKETRPAVKEVFEFFKDSLVIEDKELFFPEKIFKERDFVLENYPVDILYADMSGDSPAEKARLLEKWDH
ncbi:MAG: extracellular solute-binding protein [Clostridiaceae bacterium]|jgi:iron(III) transport system substrate-binding protein|nr:extracellular solute-binding protein [Clostridiaceae bacterium]